MPAERRHPPAQQVTGGGRVLRSLAGHAEQQPQAAGEDVQPLVTIVGLLVQPAGGGVRREGLLARLHAARPPGGREEPATLWEARAAMPAGLIPSRCSLVKHR